jgi:hypothetical protein
MKSNALDLVLLPLCQWLFITFVAMALIRAMFTSAAHWWHQSSIDEDSESSFKARHHGD